MASPTADDNSKLKVSAFDRDLDDEEWERKSAETKEKIVKFLDNAWVTIFVSVVTIWALFGDDIRVLGAGKAGDSTFYILTIICFAIFMIEIALSCYAKSDYLFTFFFWLDIVSTVTLLLDVGWISDALYGTNSDGTTGTSQNSAQIQNAAKASQVGTRAARVVRIIRLIRLIRIVKLYKATEKERIRKEKEEKARKRKQRNEIRKRLQAAGVGSDSKSINPQSGIPMDLKSMSNEHMDRLNESDDAQIPGGDKGRKISEGAEPLEAQLPGKGGKNAVMPVSASKDHKDSESVRSESKIYSHSKGGASSDIDESLKMDDEEIKDQVKESNVGKELISNITKIVIILILMIMFSVALFSYETYLTDDYTAQKSMLKHMERLCMNYEPSTYFNSSVDELYNEFLGKSSPIIYANIFKTPTGGTAILDVMSKGTSSDTDPLRQSEMTVVVNASIPSSTGYTYTVQLYFSSRSGAVLGSILSIVRTIFVCLILTFSVLKLSKDSEVLVINPLEQMVLNVRKISQNPLEAAELAEKEAEKREQLQKLNNDDWKEYLERDAYEPAVLEKNIIKIGTLLAIGFGEAGSDIIALNMKRSGTVDPMMAGVKIVAIFGFCDIRGFNEITEILKKNVMQFVNEIAEIVHNIVNEHQGAANKNIGEAFLLVWKVEHSQTCLGEDGQLVADPKSNKVKALADLATLSFIKIQAAIHRSQKLEKYQENRELKRNNHGKPYKPNMGFGLHIGWGVEGAIGSKFKIDASYLSPNVNMSARLEAASRQFGVPMLISGTLYKHMSSKFREILRHIDTVTVKGSIQPMEMYTCDLEFSQLQVYHAETDKKVKRIKVEAKKKRQEVYDLCFGDPKAYKSTAFLLESDDDFKQMRQPFTPEFFKEWRRGFDFYISGKWDEASAIFERTKTMITLTNSEGNAVPRIDGPSNTLLEVMKDRDLLAKWKNVRELTSK